MPRLIDDMRAAGRLEAPFFVPRDKGQAWRDLANNVWPMLVNLQLTVMLIDNVISYYYEGTDQENWDLTKDFPNLAPPYPQFWAEGRMPKRIVSKEKGITDVAALLPHGRTGFLVTSLDPGSVKGEIPENTRWIMWVELFIDYGGGRIEGPHGPMFMAIDTEGRLIDVPWMQSFAGPELAGIMKQYITWLHPLFLSISFLHCKNVSLEDHVVDRPLAKKFRTRHGFDPAPYKTLVIEPLRQILKHEGGSGKHGLQKAMHICRGHFRDYREGRGLFGRYHQLVWQPSIVRGTRGKAGPREVEVKV